MKSKGVGLVATISLFVLTTGALAQAQTQTHFEGLMSDYTAASVAGPWEVRGEWTLQVQGESGKADFSASLAMERSDMGVMLSGGGNLNSAAARNGHTHHITLVDGTVTPILNGFRVSGPATITGNGAFPAPFGPSSTLQIDITGGNSVIFSNIKVTFGGDAATHFGLNALGGVVRNSD